MRFGVNVIAAVFLLLSGLWGQEFKMLTPSVIDAGTVPSDTIAETTIRFTNAGDKPLEIDRIQTSCGCTVANLEKMVYQPGEEGAIHVQFNTKGYSGLTRKTITVYLKDIMPASVRVLLQVNVQPRLDTDPRFIDFQNVHISDTPVKRVIKVLNHSKKTVKSEYIKSSNSHLKVSPEQLVIAPNSFEMLTITLQPEKTGREDSYLAIEFNKPLETIKRIPIFVNVLP